MKTTTSTTAKNVSSLFYVLSRGRVAGFSGRANFALVRTVDGVVYGAEVAGSRGTGVTVWTRKSSAEANLVVRVVAWHRLYGDASTALEASKAA